MTVPVGIKDSSVSIVGKDHFPGEKNSVKVNNLLALAACGK
jgi:hypothetical protein